jgi:hypothetical protein
MQGKDILDEDAAISSKQMTSYRINVCHATSIVLVKIPHTLLKHNM